MLARYFAYGSNMNPQRVRDRGLCFDATFGGLLRGFCLQFHKSSNCHPGVGHANFAYDPDATLEGVVYELGDAEQIAMMDRFESAPVNYSREVVEVDTAQGMLWSWIYIANPAVLKSGLTPPRSYLNHLLAAETLLSAGYVEMLRGWECVENR